MTDDSLYKVSGWSNNISYSKNSIITTGNIYYYSLINNNYNFNPTSSSNWGGYSTYGSLSKPEFIWNPTYTSQLQLKPPVNVIRFGNGYEQRIADGINTNLLKLTLNFEGRNDEETRAIAHFLHKRKGADGFFFKAPFPYNFDNYQTYPKRFICEEWNINYNFYDNYTITTVFLETPNL